MAKSQVSGMKGKGGGRSTRSERWLKGLKLNLPVYREGKAIKVAHKT